MRSTSLRPVRSNKHSSTFVALAENRAKFVPRPSQLAPSGYGEPAETGPLDFRNEVDGSKRWDNKAKLRAFMGRDRGDKSSVPDVASAVDRGIGIQHLAPSAGERHGHAVVAQDFRREIDHHHATFGFAPALAEPCARRVTGIVGHQPFEASRIAVEGVQGWYVPIDAVEIAHQSLHAGVALLFGQMPRERDVVVPF